MNYLNCIDKSYKPTIRFWKMKMMSASKEDNSKFDDIIAAIISKSKDEMGEKW